MKPLLKSLVAGSLLLASAAASADVTVNFVKPENFPDMPFSPVEREAVLRDLREYFVRLGKNLPAGTDLRIDVLDVDLAGRLEPSQRGDRDLRILRGGADWPRMTLRYTVEAGGKVVSSGNATLQDMNYQSNGTVTSDGDSLRYEKHMIDQWFYKTVAPRKKG